MSTLFCNILQISFTTSIVLLLLLFFRWIFGRPYASRMLCILWLIFAIRLIIPVQMTFPDAVTLTPNTTWMETETQPIIEQTQNTPLEVLEENDMVFHDVVPMVDAKHKINFMDILGVIWFFGAITFLIFHLWVHDRFMKKIRKTSKPVTDAQIIAIYHQQKQLLNIKKQISLCQSKMVQCPMLLGIRHPMIVIPEDEVLSSDTIFVIRHELIHAKNQDIMRKSIFLLAKCMHWFNPVVHMLAWQGTQEIEMACDHMVVQDLDQEEKRLYGHCILNHISNQIEKNQFFATKLTGGKKAMKERIKTLFTKQKKKNTICFMIGGLVAFLFIGSSISVKASSVSNQEIQQMNDFANVWCDAQKKDELTLSQANAIFGAKLKEQFENDMLEEKLSINNMPMGCMVDDVSYELQPEKYTATIKVHTNDTPYGGMTQIQTLHFGVEHDELRIISRVIEDAMILDHTENICMTANDIKEKDFAQSFREAKTVEELVYQNIPVAGGRYQKNGDRISYIFADGTSVEFTFRIDEKGKYHIKSSKIGNAEAIEKDQNTIEIKQAANQWAEGYLRKNAVFAYPVMSKALQKEFIKKNEEIYGLGWFWRIGWGSSPSVKDWVVEVQPNQKALVTYILYAGGEEYRYTELLRFGKENGKMVVESCEVQADGICHENITYDAFMMMYAQNEELQKHLPQVNDALVQDWKVNEPQRYADMLVPDKALRSTILTLNEEKYIIKYHKEEFIENDVVMQDLEIIFPESKKSAFVTMYYDANQGYWKVKRIGTKQ